MSTSTNLTVLSSLDQSNGRYVQGGTTDSYSNHLGWWERTVLPWQSDDIIFTITNDVVGRPDLIASRVYGNALLAWIVLQYNTVLDLNLDLALGTQIHLPAPNRIL